MPPCCGIRKAVAAKPEKKAREVANWQSESQFGLQHCYNYAPSVLAKPEVSRSTDLIKAGMAWDALHRRACILGV